MIAIFEMKKELKDSASARLLEAVGNDVVFPCLATYPQSETIFSLVTLTFLDLCLEVLGL